MNWGLEERQNEYIQTLLGTAEDSDFPLTQTNSFKSRAINYVKCQLLGTGAYFDSEIQSFSIPNKENIQ